ncbi:MAG: hypothetical protein HQL87_12925 [Magnetococcales bacterium]|nr:hypothetical protein [Magnetococcales bacterium]
MTTRRRSFALTHPFTERNFALSDQQGDGHHADQGNAFWRGAVPMGDCLEGWTGGSGGVCRMTDGRPDFLEVAT